MRKKKRNNYTIKMKNNMMMKIMNEKKGEDCVYNKR